MRTHSTKSLPTDGRTITLQVQYRTCGKPHCRKCREGKGHGPYRYAYWKDAATGRLTSKYVGRVQQGDEVAI